MSREGFLSLSTICHVSAVQTGPFCRGVYSHPLIKGNPCSLQPARTNDIPPPLSSSWKTHVLVSHRNSLFLLLFRARFSWRCLIRKLDKFIIRLLTVCQTRGWMRKKMMVFVVIRGFINIIEGLEMVISVSIRCIFIYFLTAWL